MVRRVKMLALAVLLTVSLFIGLILLFQRHLLFPAPRWAGPATLGPRVEAITLDQGGAYLLLPDDRAEPVPLIAFAHGNAELAVWSIDQFSVFRDLGFAVLLLEYPGYGGTPGAASSTTIEASALEAIDRVIAREDIDEHRLIAYGRSIGTGAACLIAGKRKTAAVVLEAPFLSLTELVSSKGMPAFLLRDRFDNASIIRDLDTPVLVYHGTQDRIIPHAHGKALAEMARKGTLLSPKCGHNDCPAPVQEVLGFLDRWDLGVRAGR